MFRLHCLALMAANLAIIFVWSPATAMNAPPIQARGASRKSTKWQRVQKFKELQNRPVIYAEKLCFSSLSSVVFVIVSLPFNDTYLVNKKTEHWSLVWWVGHCVWSHFWSSSKWRTNCCWMTSCTWDELGVLRHFVFNPSAALIVYHSFMVFSNFTCFFCE